MSSGVNSHRVDVSEEEREQAFQDKRDSRAGSSHPQPFAHPYFAPPPLPPGAYWSPYMYSGQPMPQYHQNSAVAVPDNNSPFHHQGSMVYPHPCNQIAQQPQPQYLAVNVHTDNHQTQSQKQASTNSNKQITVKEKIIKNVTRGLEQLLDARVLAAGLATFLLPKIAQQLQQQKRKKRGLFLEFGLA